jgi:glyoxylase-like metal-dependent hydrolase (beta-lactamase superfamily II)
MGNLTWTVGDITITRVQEVGGVSPNGGPEAGLPDAWPAEVLAIPWLVPDFATEEGHLDMSVHALLVEAPGARLVVDTCIGNDKTRTMPHFDHLATDFLARMDEAGWPRESVDGVICTHLHVDHVGWNTMWVDGEWTPTFPNARYFMVRSEVDHVRGEAGVVDPDRSPYAAAMIDAANVYGDSVRPVLDAGMAELVDTDAEIAAGVRLVATPGHTPGHVSVLVESGGDAAVITGDMMHHPCQIARPEWCSAFDHDRETAIATREAFLDRFADTGTLVIGTHFGGPTAGHVVRDGDDYRMVVA